MTSRSDEVPSPCVNVCFIDTASGLCRGCLRTLQEIADWMEMSPNEKRATLRALALRREKMPHTE
jgi:predicted Fe-S protein YdhL (DUF1289 family)